MAFDRQIMLYENPRKKKRSKFIHIRKPKIAKKKMVSTASNSVHPCTECGKQFSSWKALFGHMRCHPERQWRGINPPPHYQGPRSMSPSMYFTNVDHEVATCLLMLANGNVKGCYANAISIDREEEEYEHQHFPQRYQVNKGKSKVCGADEEAGKMIMTLGHQWVFPSGQALGGHKRSHWEKGENPSNSWEVCCLDLNLPAPMDDRDGSSCSAIALDLKLGI